MIKEDHEHAANAKPFEAMTKSEEAAELVFRLRDQHGPYYMTTDRTPEDPASPASQLVKMGYAAVPALIEALKSTRYTRSVARSHMGRWPYVITEDVCAMDVLERIAGRKFYGNPEVNSPTIRAASRRRQVERWYATVQEKKH
jgi:hypothetical protein